MSTTTPNYNLIKPGQKEFYDVSVPNANMDILDGVLKTLQDAINSGATEQEIAEIRQELAAHLADKANPHGVTKTQVGLGNVDNVKQIPVNEKGAANGIATLDASKKIPTNQIPDLTSLGVIKSADGMYIGDSNTSGSLSFRFINVGFTPKLVFLTKIRPSDNILIKSAYIFRDVLNTGQDFLPTRSNEPYGVTTNGFNIGNRSFVEGETWNLKDGTYHWTAIG